MHFGRFLFGVGGESLSVAQSRITTRWFKGKELALAIGNEIYFDFIGRLISYLRSQSGIWAPRIRTERHCQSAPSVPCQRALCNLGRDNDLYSLVWMLLGTGYT